MGGTRFAYYCSGHGYGHATRVSAFTCHLLSLDNHPTVHIVSSAPAQIFADSIAKGALYRFADMDPVIVQPLAYRVDRRKSVDVLKSFLSKKQQKLEQEVRWLKETKIDCVLSDAAFLGCLAANHAGLPSILVTNFTFDSVYSYLSTSICDEPSTPLDQLGLPPTLDRRRHYPEPDVPIPHEELAPLVEEIHDGYRCADLLLLLPGAIPIPSFSVEPELPSSTWVDTVTRAFKHEIVQYLTDPLSSWKLYPSIPFSPTVSEQRDKPDISRSVRPAPLLVRLPNPSVYTKPGRGKLLSSIGVPPRLYDPERTKILVVSFGGQTFKRPQSRAPTAPPTPGRNRFVNEGDSYFPKLMRPQSRAPTAPPTPGRSHFANEGDSYFPRLMKPEMQQHKKHPSGGEELAHAMRGMHVSNGAPLECVNRELTRIKEWERKLFGNGSSRPSTPPLATPLHLWIPGAPPVAKPQQNAPSPVIPSRPVDIISLPESPDGLPSFTSIEIPPTPPTPPLDSDCTTATDSDEGYVDGYEEEGPRLLPDSSWIAVVCGVSKDWGREEGEELPEGFYVAPKDVYMPDLMAVADVLLGKLGYGTVSECVDACTPFVYVSRPLFIEEHGLKLYLSQHGVGVELARASYEAGDWADAVEEAWEKGREAKLRKRLTGETDVARRRAEGRTMAEGVMDWVGQWRK